MNKKIFFAAVAAAALTACTSEEALESVAVKPAESGMPEVVGAKLAGKGIVANLTNGEDVTRLGASGWSETDKIGLAWINNGTTDITGDQGTALVAPSALTDKKLYANTILTTFDNGKTFQSKANVYEGAYFMYSPWAYMSKIGELSFTPNATKQEKDVDTERYEKLPWISGLQFITANPDIENGDVKVDFELNPIANTLRVTTEPADNVKKALKDYVISLAQIDVRNNSYAPVPVFYQSLALDPKKLAENADDLDAAVKAMVVTTPETSYINTSVDSKYAKASLAGNGEFRFFALPTDASPIPAGKKIGTDYLISFNFQVSDKDGNVIGYFILCNPLTGAYSCDANVATAQKLLEALETPSGLFAKSITRILRGSTGKPAALSLPLKLNVEDLNVTLFDEISNIDEWNLAVELFDALHEGETDAVANFTVDGPIAFVDEIKVPETAKQLNVKTTGTPAASTFAGEGEMPAKIKGAAYATNNLHIVVLNDAELTVNCNNEESTIGNVTFGTIAAAATDDPATEDVNETVPGRIIIGSADAQVNTEAGNNGEIIVKQSAVVADGNNVKRPAIYNAAAGAIIYEITSDLEDKAGTTAGAFTKAMFDATSPLNNANVLRVKDATVKLNAYSIALTTAAIELTNANIEQAMDKTVNVKNISSKGTSSVKAGTVTVTDATDAVVVEGSLNVTIKTQAFSATNEISGATASGNKLTVDGEGTVSGKKIQTADSKITVVIEGSVTNSMS